MDASVTKVFGIKKTLNKKEYELYLIRKACRGDDKARETWRKTFTSISEEKQCKKL